MNVWPWTLTAWSRAECMEGENGRKSLSNLAKDSI